MRKSIIVIYRVMKLTLSLSLSFVVFIASSQAATISSYDFSTDANPTSELANTSSSAFTGANWTSGGTPSFGRSSSSLSYFGRGPSNVAGTSYIEFTASADPTYAISLTSLSFDYHMSQMQGGA